MTVSIAAGHLLGAAETHTQAFAPRNLSNKHGSTVRHLLQQRMPARQYTQPDQRVQSVFKRPVQTISVQI
jgi:hypothetical protein